MMHKKKLGHEKGRKVPAETVRKGAAAMGKAMMAKPATAKSRKPKSY